MSLVNRLRRAIHAFATEPEVVLHGSVTSDGPIELRGPGTLNTNGHAVTLAALEVDGSR